MPSACFKCGDMQIAIETIMDCHRNMPRHVPTFCFLPYPQKTVQWINAGGTETKNIKNILLTMPVLAFGEKPNPVGT